MFSKVYNFADNGLFKGTSGLIGSFDLLKKLKSLGMLSPPLLQIPSSGFYPISLNSTVLVTVHVLDSPAAIVPAQSSLWLSVFISFEGSSGTVSST